MKMGDRATAAGQSPTARTGGEGALRVSCQSSLHRDKPGGGVRRLTSAATVPVVWHSRPRLFSGPPTYVGYVFSDHDFRSLGPPCPSHSSPVNVRSVRVCVA
jgi:hypothetical protein